MLACLIAACGGATTKGSESLPPEAVAAASTLLPDGSVPYLEEPAEDREFFPSTPPEPTAGDAKPCSAQHLSAELPGWTHKGGGAEEEGVRQVSLGLLGEIEVSLRGDNPCTLQGSVAVRLRIDGRDAPVQYGKHVNDEALRRTTVVTPRSPARLRLDWSPPYCGPTGRQELSVELPHDGGRLTAPVRRPAVRCAPASPWRETGDSAPTSP